MLHLGTGGSRRVRPRRSPAGDRKGPWRRATFALNTEIDGFGKLIYVRPMAEMNGRQRLLVRAEEGRRAHTGGLQERVCRTTSCCTAARGQV